MIAYRHFTVIYLLKLGFKLVFYGNCGSKMYCFWARGVGLTDRHHSLLNGIGDHNNADTGDKHAINASTAAGGDELRRSDGDVVN